MLKEVTYTRLVNLGNYENETLTLTATVGDGERAKEVYEKLQITANKLLGLDERPSDWFEQQVKAQKAIEKKYR